MQNKEEGVNWHIGFPQYRNIGRVSVYVSSCIWACLFYQSFLNIVLLVP